MSSINPHFTFHYSQPQDYRFSHDSVFMARQVFELLAEPRRQGLRDWDVLDLCSGCGIIGLDFLVHLRNAGEDLPSRMDFLDVQSVYAEHFARNAASLSGCELHFINDNYSSLLDGRRKYDLILCNPPYFRPGQGALSPSDFKNRCRFFMDSDFSTLLAAVVSALRPDGRAFVLLRDLSEHGVNVRAEAKHLLSGRATIESMNLIRGTELVQITLGSQN